MKRYYAFILTLLLPFWLFAQSFGPDKIADVTAKGSAGTLVILEGEIEEIDQIERSIVLGDRSGSILIVSEKELPGDLEKGHRLAITGKIVEDGSEISVKANSIRKISYVKDPAHCCQTD